MATNKQQQLGNQGNVLSMGKKRMNRSPSFSDWKGAESSFSMLKNRTNKPDVKIEAPSVEPPCPMNPVVSCVVPKGPRTQRQDPGRSPKQRIATPARGTHREHNPRITNTIPKSCQGVKRKEPDANLHQALVANVPNLPTPLLNINALIVKTEDRRFCEVCQLSCSNDLNFKQHLVGAIHKSKMEYKERKYSCNLCRIVCPDGDNLNMHLIGKKHMAEKKKMQNGVQKPLHCELCLVSCQNMDIFQSHLDGKPHAARVKEIACRGITS